MQDLHVTATSDFLGSVHLAHRTSHKFLKKLRCAAYRMTPKKCQFVTFSSCAVHNTKFHHILYVKLAKLVVRTRADRETAGSNPDFVKILS